MTDNKNVRVYVCVCVCVCVNKKKYSRKRQSAGSNPFCPKLSTLILIPHSRWHQPLCSSKICATHTHDKPQISPNWVFSYMPMEFVLYFHIDFIWTLKYKFKFYLLMCISKFQ